MGFVLDASVAACWAFDDEDHPTAAFLHAVARLPIALDPVAEDDSVLALARAHRLSVYDAAYLELAQRAVLPLATLDAALVRAARAEGLALIED